MAKESTYPTTSLTEGDYIRIIDDPSGTPLTRNVSTSHALANLNTGSGFSIPTQSGTPPTYTVQASDFGKVLVSNQAITNYFTIPDGLPSNFYFYVYQAGVGSSVIQGNGTSSVAGVTSSGDQLVATGAQKAVIEVRPYGTDTYVCFGSNLAIPPFANSYSVGGFSYNTANYVSFTTISVLNSASTFSLFSWVKIPSTSSASRVYLWYFADAQNYITLVNNNSVSMRIDNVDDSIATSGWADDTWHSIGFTFGSNTAEFFLDGVSGGTAAVAASTPADFGITPQIGGQVGYGQWDGNIDSIGVFNSVLTAVEFLALHNLGVPISLASDSGNYASSADLIHWFRGGDSDGGTGTTMSDVIGSVVGTLNGACAFETEVP